ncbi:chloride channel protein [Leptolyngbya sp. AN02str]|uniref:chloride channel protein n=1 Tax=Leptolyngbya sp. AN02str TaxID=3423363 RepID=UPI003D3130F5
MTAAPDRPSESASNSSQGGVGHWLAQQLRPTPDTILLLLALLIGSGAGAGVVVFRFLIRFVHRLMLGEVSGFLSTWGHWTLALIPLIGGIIVGLLRWAVGGYGPGLTALIEMVEGGRELVPLKPISKMLAAAISLGSGASLGPEGPSVEIGANFSLLLGQVMKVSHDRQRVLLGAGAAAGLAAGFNAPIAGVFFALEVVIGPRLVKSAASVVLIASVVAAWIAQIGLGSKPAFELPAYEVRSLLELPLYLGLGLLASLVSIWFKGSMGFTQKLFQGQLPGLQWMANIPNLVHPVIGGLCVGAIALQFPQILGIGYETVESILQDVKFPLQLVMTLLVMKLIMTSISFGSGFVGGVFAPALFLGASLGSVYGKVMALTLPMLNPYMASPPAYAMVGMAAVLAGSVRAPLTSILLLFELTQDYRIVLPLMAAVSLSAWSVELLQPTAMDSDGEQQTAPPEEREIPASLLVADAMQPPALLVSTEMSVQAVAHLLVEKRLHCALVLDEQDALLGLLTLTDINRLVSKAIDQDAAGILQEPIGQHCTTKLVYAHPDELLTDAIAHMTTRGLHQLPVITADSPAQVVGLLTDEGIELAVAIARTNLALKQVQPEPERVVEPVA